MQKCDKFVGWPIDSKFLWYNIFPVEHQFEHLFSQASSLPWLMHIKIEDAHCGHLFCFAIFIKNIQVFRANFQKSCHTTTKTQLIPKHNFLSSNDSIKSKLKHVNQFHQKNCSVIAIWIEELCVRVNSFIDDQVTTWTEIHWPKLSRSETNTRSTYDGLYQSNQIPCHSIFFDQFYRVEFVRQCLIVHLFP